MKLSYRNEKNAKALSAFWGKQIDGKSPYIINAISDDESVLFIQDALGWPWNDINAMIRDVSAIKSKNLLIRLNSPGGDPIDSFALYHELKNHQSKVTIRIEAMAASAASFLALAGDEIQAYPSSLMMIHNSYVLTCGNRFELQSTADILEKIDNNMQDIYTARTKIGKREMADMMKAETWFSAKEMKEKGFIDTILDGKGAKAEFDLSIFANIPDELKSESLPKSEPDIRSTEKLLRDVGGFSKNRAKAILARGWQADGEEIGNEIEQQKHDADESIIRSDAGTIKALLTRNIELYKKGY